MFPSDRNLFIIREFVVQEVTARMRVRYRDVKGDVVDVNVE